jgi:hypothetical protein
MSHTPFVSFEDFQAACSDQEQEPARKIWLMVMLMAIKNRATSLRYEPERGAQPLLYVAGGREHALATPPEHLRGRLVEDIERLVAPPAEPVCLGFTRFIKRKSAHSEPVPRKWLIELEIGDQVVDAIMTIWPTETGRSVQVRFVDDTARLGKQTAASVKAREVFARWMNERRITSTRG